MSAPPRLRVVARGDVAKTHVARFSSVVDPGLARADITVTMARDDTAIMRRVRRGAAEATRPWLLTAPHPQRAPEPLTYVGSLEESQCDKYVLLVPDGGELRMVPCHEWYTFVPRPARIAEMKREDQERAQREAEEKMRARHAQSDLYLERKVLHCAVPHRAAPRRAAPRRAAPRRAGTPHLFAHARHARHAPAHGPTGAGRGEDSRGRAKRRGRDQYTAHHR